MSYEVIQGDCLAEMAKLPPNSIDACITDPPYGTTACSWDSVIPFAPMWAELKRIVKPKGVIVLFGSQPFSSALVMSNPQMFKYDWIWKKNYASGFANAHKQPMRNHESILVFASNSHTYNPDKQRSQSEEAISRARKGDMARMNTRKANPHKLGTKLIDHPFNEFVFPVSVQEFACESRYSLVHETQKPVDLLRYLVRTYTNAGDTVLDFTCGSGTTGVACAIEGRNSINIEQDTGYCEIARARIMRASGIACDIPKRARPETPLPLFEAVA